MLISPPFLLPRQANETDEAYVARCMPDSSVIVPGTNGPEGSYPVSFKLGWHGGLHLQAPTGADTNVVTSVRAIADGEIVYARQPAARNTTPSPAEPHNYNPYGDDPRWTDDGCVVIRHRTEIGVNRQTNAATQVTFLSIYMHLGELRGVARQVAAGTATNRNVYRKDVIGLAGHVYGNGHQLHLEIACDDDNLQRLVNRPTGELNTAQDGRDDSVFGEIYFRLPQGTPFYARRPPYNVTGGAQAGAQAGTLQEPELYVGLRYSGGEVRAAGHHRGDAYLTSYRADGTPVGDAVHDQDAEYNLYSTATDISNAYPANARPAPSAVYELLRFGRVIGPDALNPADVPHWRRVPLPGGTPGWVNLNAQGVCRFSDADFPLWRGWRLIDDDADADSRCESAQLTALIEDAGTSDGQLTRAELESRLGRADVRARLKRTICKFPTEWDRASAPARWGWLNGDPEFGLDAEHFNELMAHANVLTFDWAAAGTGIGTTHWHLQPREFVVAWRGCGWLSGSELSRIYTPTPVDVRNTYIVALNRMMRRYIIQSGLRQSHFLGQGAVESSFLRAMQEKSMRGRVEGTRLLGDRANPASATQEATLGHWYGALPEEDDPWFRLEKYNSLGGRITGSYSWVNGNVGDVDAQKFRGRGFKQLTGLDNYAEYWVYRGWLQRSSFDAHWWGDPQYRARNSVAMRLRPARVDDPQRVAANAENCMDSGGWYMVFRRPRVMATIDADTVNAAVTPAQQAAETARSLAVTFAINGGHIDAERRLQYTREAKEILL